MKQPPHYIWPTDTLALSCRNMTKVRIILMFALSPQKYVKKACLDFRKEKVFKFQTKPQQTRGLMSLQSYGVSGHCFPSCCLFRSLVFFLLHGSLVKLHDFTARDPKPDLGLTITEEHRLGKIVEIQVGPTLGSRKLSKRGTVFALCFH